MKGLKGVFNLEIIGDNIIECNMRFLRMCIIFYDNNIFAFYCIYEHMILNRLGKCCNQINIQSDGPASVYQSDVMGDYERNGNDSNTYKNMNSGLFLYKDGHKWMVCNNCKFSLL